MKCHLNNSLTVSLCVFVKINQNKKLVNTGKGAVYSSCVGYSITEERIGGKRYEQNTSLTQKANKDLQHRIPYYFTKQLEP